MSTPMLNFTGTTNQEDSEQVSLLSDDTLDFGPPPKESGPKHVILQLLCGIGFLFVITGLVVIMVLFGAGTPKKYSLGFDDMFSPDFQPKVPKPVWLPSGRAFLTKESVNDTDCIFQTDVEPYTHTPLVCADKLLPGLKISDFSLSFNGSFLLLPFNQKPIWRHSFYANYLIVNTSNPSSWWWLANSSDPSAPNQEQIISAIWNPAKDTIAYVKNNNLFISQDISELKPGTTYSPASDQQITSDGGDSILNGIASWVYEEEVLGFANTAWWSPDGSSLAFFKTNESMVKLYNIPFYDGPSENEGYTRTASIRYPKAGSPNPVVDVIVHRVASQEQIALDYTSKEYVTDLAWKSTDILTIRTENRAQTVETMFFYNVTTPVPSGKILMPWINTYDTRQVQGNGWLEPSAGSIRFIDGDRFLMITNNNDNYHIGIYSSITGTFQSCLTSGKWDVTSIIGYNSELKLVFFLSTEVSPTQSHLYSVTIDGKVKAPLTSGTGFYTATFNSVGNHLILYYNGPNVPYTKLMSVEAGQILEVKTLEDNSALSNKLNQYDIPQKRYITVTVPSNSTSTVTLNAWIMFPPHLGSASYPLLLNVYTGPGSQTVTQQYALGLNEYLCSSLNIAVGSIDPRGTGGRGVEFTQQTYLNLGRYESRDVTNGAFALANMYDLDPFRMGIWGWSYGGYMTLMSLVNIQPSPFKLGVSVAPVTDWHLYDTFYTERFMGTPTSNQAGYNRTSVLKLANRTTLKDNQLLLIHGSGDDNVHFQNSMELNKVLIKEGVQYDTMVYTNRNHGISGDGARQHLYQKIHNFLKSHL